MLTLYMSIWSWGTLTIWPARYHSSIMGSMVSMDRVERAWRHAGYTRQPETGAALREPMGSLGLPNGVNAVFGESD